MRKSWRTLAIFLFTFAVLAGAFYGTRIQALTEETRESMKLYTELLGAARQNYGAEVNYRDLVYASIQGLTRTLDPHTSFLPPQAYDGMRQRQQASFYGLGILVGQRNGRVTVITPIEGGPASRLGIRAGDVIDTIDGEDTEPMGIDDAVKLLKGPKGTPVTITVLRRGLEKPLEMTVIRAEIPLTTVRYSYMMAPGTGYMRITDFSRSTGQEVRDRIAELRGQGMERLLLDLRNNGGGLLDQAIEVGELFVPKGSKIVETRGRTRNSRQVFRADEQSQELQVPVVVLVNTGTASAAEILAGAIQDHDIGIIAQGGMYNAVMRALAELGLADAFFYGGFHVFEILCKFSGRPTGDGNQKSPMGFPSGFFDCVKLPLAVPRHIPFTEFLSVMMSFSSL